MNAYLVDTFERTLNNLRFIESTDKAKQHQLINNLKRLALAEDPACREDIVVNIRSFADIVDPDLKVLIIDLIHALISSSIDEYRNFFNEHIVDIFFSAYIHASKLTRAKLFETREQWQSYFPKDVLKELDDTIKNVDPEYPVVQERSEYQEKIDLYREIQALRILRDELQADLENPQPSKANVPKSAIEPLPKSLENDEVNDEDSIDDSRIDAILAEMKFCPQLIEPLEELPEPKDLQRINGPSGNTSMSENDKHSHVSVSRHEPYVMDRQSVARPSVNNVLKRPFAALKASRQKVAAFNLSESKPAPANILDMLLNNMTTLYGYWTGVENEGGKDERKKESKWSPIPLPNPSDVKIWCNFLGMGSSNEWYIFGVYYWYYYYIVLSLLFKKKKEKNSFREFTSCSLFRMKHK